MLRRCPGPKVGLLHRAWSCFPRGRSSLCCSATSRGSFGLQSTAPAPFPLPGVSLETVSWHGGRITATPAILRNSQAEVRTWPYPMLGSITYFSMRHETGQHCWSSACPRDFSSIPEQCLRCGASCCQGSGSCCAPGRQQLLSDAQPAWSMATGPWPRGPGHLLAVKICAWCSLQLGCGEEIAEASRKENSQTRESPVAVNTKPCVVTGVMNKRVHSQHRECTESRATARTADFSHRQK